jgi:hypothetical protein
MVRGFEVSHLLGEMNIRNVDIHPNGRIYAVLGYEQVIRN